MATLARSSKAPLLLENLRHAVNAYHQFEFLIQFSNFNRRDLAKCVAKLPRRPNGRSESPHFELRLEPEGFYFRDLACSTFSAKMLRIVLELALEHSEVRIEGFGSGTFARAGGRLTGEFTEFDALLKRYRESVMRLDLGADPATSELAGG